MARQGALRASGAASGERRVRRRPDMKPGDHPEFFRFPAPEGRSRESTIRLDGRGRFWHDGALVEHAGLAAGASLVDRPAPRRRPLHPDQRLRLDVLHGRRRAVLRPSAAGRARRVVLQLSDGTGRAMGAWLDALRYRRRALRPGQAGRPGRALRGEVHAARAGFARAGARRGRAERGGRGSGTTDGRRGRRAVHRRSGR